MDRDIRGKVEEGGGEISTIVGSGGMDDSEGEKTKNIKSAIDPHTVYASGVCMCTYSPKLKNRIC